MQRRGSDSTCCIFLLLINKFQFSRKLKTGEYAQKECQTFFLAHFPENRRARKMTPRKVRSMAIAVHTPRSP